MPGSIDAWKHRCLEALMTGKLREFDFGINFISGDPRD
jgi:hypothetical protein